MAGEEVSFKEEEAVSEALVERCSHVEFVREVHQCMVCSLQSVMKIDSFLC